jgi:hypothetical protein
MENGHKLGAGQAAPHKRGNRIAQGTQMEGGPGQRDILRPIVQIRRGNSPRRRAGAWLTIKGSQTLLYRQERIRKIGQRVGGAEEVRRRRIPRASRPPIWAAGNRREGRVLRPTLRRGRRDLRRRVNSSTMRGTKSISIVQATGRSSVRRVSRGLTAVRGGGGRRRVQR